MTVSKKEIATAVATKLGVTNKDAVAFVEAFQEVVTEKVAAGEKVALTGFGSFEGRERAARTGRNPITGAPIQIAATKVPAFKAGKSFKEAINK